MHEVKRLYDQPILMHALKQPIGCFFHTLQSAAVQLRAGWQ
ncbi:MAG: hypothetical protein ACAF41_21505 [Leptolyngbya sp. BL-A-14]